MSNVGYSLTPQPDHPNAPDAWAVWARDRSVDADGDINVTSELISAGRSLAESQIMIDLHQSGDPVDWWSPLWETS